MSTNFKSKMVVVAMILAGLLAGPARGDFTLTDNQQLTVDTHHDNGWLYDTSRATIVTGGQVGSPPGGPGGIAAYNSSTVNISGGDVYHLDAYNSSVVNISGGDVYHLDAYNFSAVNINASDGLVGTLAAFGSSTVRVSGSGDWSLGDFYARDSSAVNIYSYSGRGIDNSMGNFIARNSGILNIFGGSISGASAYNYSAVNVYGGEMFGLCAYDSSVVKIYGGVVVENDPFPGGLRASDLSTVTFYGQNYLLGEGLSLDGNRILGTGILSGRCLDWMNGGQWTVNILENDPTATIMIPEPATMALLGLGGLALLRKRRA